MSKSPLKSPLNLDLETVAKNIRDSIGDPEVCLVFINSLTSQINERLGMKIKEIASIAREDALLVARYLSSYGDLRYHENGELDNFYSESDLSFFKGLINEISEKRAVYKSQTSASSSDQGLLVNLNLRDAIANLHKNTNNWETCVKIINSLINEINAGFDTQFKGIPYIREELDAEFFVTSLEKIYQKKDSGPYSEFDLRPFFARLEAYEDILYLRKWVEDDGLNKKNDPLEVSKDNLPPLPPRLIPRKENAPPPLPPKMTKGTPENSSPPPLPPRKENAPPPLPPRKGSLLNADQGADAPSASVNSNKSTPLVDGITREGR